ncbi:hypothetical protein [Trichocoleus sp. DQ-U1]|uniref:hypothetical protein n=1 Tax=Trichocoleus sp. DQ-U1 TaxID=2933926 RepID=UPI003297E425
MTVWVDAQVGQAGMEEGQRETLLLYHYIFGTTRYFTPEGDRVPTPEEAAQQAQVQAQQAQAQAQQAQSQLEQERQRAERLAERLRSLGIDPE